MHMDRRPKNLSGLFLHPVFLAGLAVVTLATYRLPAQQGGDTLRFADGLFQQRRYDLAAEEYQKFLRENKQEKSPEAIAANYALATSQLFLGRYAEARTSFENYLKIAPADHANFASAQFRVGETSYLMGDMEKAESALATYLDKSPASHSQRDSALVYAGDVALRREKLDAAIGFYEKSLDQFPKGRLATRAQFGLGRSLAQKNRNADALKLFRALQAAGGEEWSERAWYQIVLQEIALKQFDDAAKSLAELEKANPRGPSSPDARWKLATALLNEKQPAKAETQLRILAAIDPPTAVSIEAASKLADLLIEAKKGRETLELLVPLLKRLEGQAASVPLVYQSAEAQILTDDKESARQRLIMLADQYPADAWADDARLRAADLAAEARDWTVARAQVDKLLKDQPSSPLVPEARLLKARVEAGEGKHQAAAEILESLVKDKLRVDLSSSARYQLAMAYQAMGQGEKARTILATLSAGNMPKGSAEARLLLGQSAFEAKKYDEATTALEAYLQTKPTRLADHALAWLAISQWETGKKAESAKTLKQLETDFPKSKTLVPTALRLGESALEAKELAQAAAWLELVSRQADAVPVRARAYTSLGYVYSEMKRPADSAKAFATAAEMSKLDTATAQEAAMAASKVLENSGKFDESLAQIEKLLAVGDKLPAPLAKESMLRKARLLSRAGKVPESAEAYAQYADKHLKEKAEGGDQILSEWAYLLLDAGKIADADKVFERILKDSPGSKFAAESRLNLAESAYTAKDYEKVKSLLAEVVEAKSKGQVDDSLRESAIYRLARAELEQKHWDASRELWTRLRTDYPKSPLANESAFWLGEIAIRTDRQEEATKILDDLIENLPKEEKPAWLGTAQLRRVQALTSLKKWEDVNKLAETLLSDAEFSKNPEFSGEVNYARGRAFQGMARFDDSRKAYQSVIDAKPAGDLAAKAQFMRGETYFHERNYREALREFLKVDILHDSTVWQAAALLEGGKVYEQLNQPADAADLYKRLVERFPNEPAAIEAKTRLVALKVPATVR